MGGIPSLGVGFFAAGALNPLASNVKIDATAFSAVHF
jgi:hypothetical protein